MADYYPLLSRAVAGLTGQPATERQAIFVRAREALERQLRGFEPALDEAAIRTELDTLEAAIARIEAENAAATESVSAVEAAVPVAPLATSEPETAPADPKIDGQESSPARNDAPTHDAHENTPDAKPDTPDALAAEPSVAANDSVPPHIPPDVSPPTPPEIPPRPPAAENTPAVEQGDRTAPDSETLPPTLRPRMPARRETDTRKKPLALFAGIAVVAMLVMGLVALTQRGGPDRFKAPPLITAPDSSADSSKTEGRLAGSDAATKPAEPTTPPAKPTDDRRPPVVEPAPTPSAPTSPGTTASSVAAPTVSRAFMVLEIQGVTPNQFEGRALWSFAPDPALKGQRTLRALIDFPAGGLSVDFSIARHPDAELNASHTVMVIFEPKNGIENIREMSAVEWRERENQAGSVLAGMIVPVQDNIFMIGLDKTDAAQARNLDLLRSQKWMVFEIRLANGRRGAILVEKGVNGEKTINDALAAWK